MFALGRLSEGYMGLACTFLFNLSTYNYFKITLKNSSSPEPAWPRRTFTLASYVPWHIPCGPSGSGRSPPRDSGSVAARGTGADWDPGKVPPAPDPGAEPGEGLGSRRKPWGPSCSADPKATFARARVCSEALRSGPESLPSRPQAGEPSGCRQARGEGSFSVLQTGLPAPAS